jgi:tetratricopeptide (TPR) repeat protein
MTHKLPTTLSRALWLVSSMTALYAPCAMAQTDAHPHTATFAPQLPINTVAKNTQTTLQSDADAWDENTVNTFLNAEFLALNEQFETAALVLWSKAQQQPNPIFLERILQWSAVSKRMDLSYDAADLWEKSSPHSPKAQEWLNTLLLITQKYDDFSRRLSARYPASMAPSADALDKLSALTRQLKLDKTSLNQIYFAAQSGLKPHVALGHVQQFYGLLARQAELKSEALEHFRSASIAESPSAYAIAYLFATEPNKALNAAKSWTQQHPTSPQAWRTLAKLHSQQKHPQAAADSLAQALKHLPKPAVLSDAVELWLSRMEQERLANNFAAASHSLMSAYAAKSSLRQASQAALARQLGQELDQMGWSQEALACYSLAETLNQILGEKNDAGMTDEWLSALEHNDAAKRLLAKIKAHEAAQIASHQLILKAKLGERAALNELLALQASSDKPTENTDSSDNTDSTEVNLPSTHRIFTLSAIEALQNTAKRTPTTTTADLEKALALCAQLPEEDRPYEIAVIYEIMGKQAESITLLRQLLAKAPEDVGLLNSLGYGLVDHNESPELLQEGTALLEKAYAKSPSSMAINDSLGWAYFRAKRYEEALPLLKKAYAMRPVAEVAAHLGELLWRTGSRLEARKVWQKAWRTDPRHPVLLKTIESMQATGIIPALKPAAK